MLPLTLVLIFPQILFFCLHGKTAQVKCSDKLCCWFSFSPPLNHLHFCLTAKLFSLQKAGEPHSIESQQLQSKWISKWRKKTLLTSKFLRIIYGGLFQHCINTAWQVYLLLYMWWCPIQLVSPLATEYKSISAEQTCWATPLITGMKSSYFARQNRKLPFLWVISKTFEINSNIWQLSLNSYEAFLCVWTDLTYTQF